MRAEHPVGLEDACYFKYAVRSAFSFFSYRFDHPVELLVFDGSTTRIVGSQVGRMGSGFIPFPFVPAVIPCVMLIGSHHILSLSWMVQTGDASPMFVNHRGFPKFPYPASECATSGADGPHNNNENTHVDYLTINGVGNL